MQAQSKAKEASVDGGGSTNTRGSSPEDKPHKQKRGLAALGESLRRWPLELAGSVVHAFNPSAWEPAMAP